MPSRGAVVRVINPESTWFGEYGLVSEAVEPSVIAVTFVKANAAGETTYTFQLRDLAVSTAPTTPVHETTAWSVLEIASMGLAVPAVFMIAVSSLRTTPRPAHTAGESLLTMREGAVAQNPCGNSYCTCGPNCGCGAGCQCGKPAAEDKLTENSAATIARSNPVVMLQGAEAGKTENPCGNAYCTCGPNCGCGAGCQCGKPAAVEKLTENFAATITARSNPVVMLQGAGAASEKTDNPCGNAYCTCGPNCGCGAGCQCGKPAAENKQ
jgi:hypothetical protein